MSGAGSGPEPARPPTGDPVEVSFDLTPEEWIEVAWEHNRKSPIYRNAMRNATGIFVILVVLLSLLSALQGAGLFSLAWLFAGAVGAAVLPKLLESSQRAQYKKFADEGIANGMFGTHRVRLLEEGMLDETDAYQSITRWHAIERIVDSDGAFMIYTGKNAFLPIPHSAFRDSATLRAFGDRFFSLQQGAAAQRLQHGPPACEGPELEQPSAPTPEPADTD